MKRLTHYQEMIQNVLDEFGHEEIDPRHVEAFMRLENPTLDSLTEMMFIHEVLISARSVAEMGPEDAEELAESFGL